MGSPSNERGRPGEGGTLENRPGEIDRAKDTRPVESVADLGSGVRYALDTSYVAVLPAEDTRCKQTPTPPNPERLVDRALTDLEHLLTDLRDDIEHGKWKATRWLDIEDDSDAYDAILDTFEGLERDVSDRVGYVVRLLETLSGHRPYVAGIEVTR